MLEELEKETGIEVEITVIGDESSLRDKVLTATMGRIAPADVIFVGITNFGVFSHSGSLAKLDGLVSADLLNNLNGEDLCRMEGSLYSVPIYQQLVMLEYDPVVLSEIDAEVPKTWDEFFHVAKDIKQKGIMDHPIAFSPRNWSWYLIALSMGDPLFDDEFNPTFDQPSSGGAKAMHLLYSFFKEGLISPERLANPNPHPSFWAGNAVFHQAWQGSLTISNDPEKSKIAPNVRYMLLPEEHFTWNLPAALGISAFSDKTQAAMQFITWITKDKTQEYLYDAYGMFPASRSALVKLGDDGKIDDYDTILEQSKYVRPLPYQVPWYSEFETELNDTLKRMVREQISPDGAIKHLAAYVDKLRAEYA